MQLPVAPVPKTTDSSCFILHSGLYMLVNDAAVATLAEGVSSRAALRLEFLLYHISVLCSLNLMPLASCHLLLFHDMVVYLLPGVLSWVR